jgi:hypothetical protein
MQVRTEIIGNLYVCTYPDSARAAVGVKANRDLGNVPLIRQGQNDGTMVVVYDLAQQINTMSGDARPVPVAEPVPVGDDPPACATHQEVQHRDGRAPWCHFCGWNHGRPAVPARPLGTVRTRAPASVSPPSSRS